MKIYLILTISFLCNIQIVLACRCIGPSNFCQSTISSEGTISSNISVIRVIVEQSEQNELKVLVTDFLGGLTPNSNYLRIIGGNGGNCYMSVSCFKAGEELILAAQYFKNYDAYSLFACGVPYLYVENEIVKGRIAGDLREIPYHQLGEVLSCRQIKTTSLKQRVNVFPTVSRDQLHIQITDINKIALRLAWDIFAADGRLVLSSAWRESYPNEKIPINISSIPQGLYYLRIKNPGEDIVTYKLIKVN